MKYTGNSDNIKISITGDLGSGKTTVGRILVERLGLKYYSAGTIQRSLAEKHGMDVLEFNKYMENHHNIDSEIDQTLAEIGLLNEDMLLDSRLAWHFVPDTYKVYLAVDAAEAARRIFNAQRGKIESYSSVEEALEKTLQRKASELYRYQTIYGVDCTEMKNYDLIVDTTNITPDQAANIIIENLRLIRSEV